MKRAVTLFLSTLAVSTVVGALGAPGFKVKEAQACFSTEFNGNDCYCMPGTRHKKCRTDRSIAMNQYCVMSIEGCGIRTGPVVSVDTGGGLYCGYQCGNPGYY